MTAWSLETMDITQCWAFSVRCHVMPYCSCCLFGGLSAFSFTVRNLEACSNRLRSSERLSHRRVSHYLATLKLALEDLSQCVNELENAYSRQHENNSKLTANVIDLEGRSRCQNFVLCILGLMEFIQGSPLDGVFLWSAVQGFFAERLFYLHHRLRVLINFRGTETAPDHDLSATLPE